MPLKSSKRSSPPSSYELLSEVGDPGQTNGRHALAAARDLLIDYANASEADKSEVAAGAEMLAKARAAAAPAMAIFDVAVAKRLGVTIDEAWDAEQFGALAAMREVREAVDPLQPAHMPYLFPEVFLRERPGFDALVGNPPWEKLQVEEHSFYALTYPGLRGLAQEDAETLVQKIRAERPDLVSAYDLATRSMKSVQTVLARGPFPGMTSGRPDLYKAFAWRFWQLARTDGRVGIVLPRKALEASGMKEWRLAMLEHGTFTDVSVLANTGGWVFPGIDQRLTVAAVSILADHTQTAKSAVIRGPFTSAQAFTESALHETAPVDVAALLSWSPGGVFPLLPNAASSEVFFALRSQPRLDQEDDLFSVRGLREWNATDDKHRFALGAKPADFIPVYKGDSFDLWNPSTGSVYAWADPDRMNRELQERRGNQVRIRRSAFFGMPDEWASDPSTLPMHRPRIAWRDTTNRTNQRTLIAAMVPPRIVMVHQAYYLFFRRGSSRDEAYVLGVLSSLPFDWYARQMVETHATVEFLLGSPVPRPDDPSPLRRRIIEISGRLAAVDARFQTWAAEVGVEVGTANTEPVKSELIAELDALVSLLYGLTPEQVEHVFATFHRGWDYTARLERVLAHYEQWEDAA